MKKDLLILGATGAVGLELLKLLEKRDYPVDRLGLFATKRSAGKCLKFRGREIEVQEISESSFADYDIAIFSAGGTASRYWAPIAVEHGLIVIDNSSAWRMDDAIPLVVPEINPEAVPDNFSRGIIANPNCSTIQLVLSLKLLADEFGLQEVFVSTYQSVSGTGHDAITELETQITAHGSREEFEIKVYEKQIFLNVLPKIGEFTETGSTSEEDKMLFETRKILNLPSLKVYPTAVRVPVIRGHSETVTVRLEKEFNIEDVLKLFSESSYLKLVKTPDYPTSIESENREETFIGRVRKSKSDKNVLSFWVVSDNLWKGAALNAIQIAELFKGS